MKNLRIKKKVNKLLTFIKRDLPRVTKESFKSEYDKLAKSEDNKIEKLYGIVNPREGTEILPSNEELMYKINEIIEVLNEKNR